MSVLNKIKKSELLCVAHELELNPPSGATVLGLKQLIEESEIFKNDIEFVKQVISEVLEEKAKLESENIAKIEREKAENEAKIELERLKLAQLEKELEIANIKSKSSTPQIESKSSEEALTLDLENLVKSIRTLTISVPSHAESFNLFFTSLEKAFKSKNVPEELKSEILLNLLGEKAKNLMVYISQEDLCNYEKLKERVLKEYQPTPHQCLYQFKKAQKQTNESYVQFALRLSANFNYYCQLRKVNDFKSLCELIVSDKIFDSLESELKTHIAVKSEETFFTPEELGRQCDIFISSKSKTKNDQIANYQKNRNNIRSYKNVTNSLVSTRGDKKLNKCIMCVNESHPLYLCNNFKKLSINERLETVKKHNLCYKCLSKGCHVKICKSRDCSICFKPHSSLIHFARNPDTRNINNSFASGATGQQAPENPLIYNDKRESLNPCAPEFSAVSNIALFCENKNKMTLLSTGIVYIRGENGGETAVRAIFDSGSESNFISKRCLDILNLKREKTDVIVSGINGLDMSIKSYVSACVHNSDNSYVRKMNFLVIPKITTDLTPYKKMEIRDLDLSNVKLADKNFNIPQKTDILIGAANFYDILRPGQIRVSNSDLILQNTVFGFVASGTVATENANKIHCGLIKENVNLDQTLRKFWEIENIEGDIPKNKETVICENNFLETHTRDETGRYVVKMPLKEDPSVLGESKDVALRILKSSWNRLSRDINYFNLYNAFMEEYENLGHMREVSEEKEPDVVCYIPHHGVYKPDKISTPLRVVFNASSPTSNGTSLNSLQYNGGVIQDDLFAIMTRFRKHIFAFSADIKKMYRMIRLHPSQLPLQRILWQKDPNEPVKTYELCTVTYGTVSASFLAMRTLKQLSVDEGDKFPLAAPVVACDFYMDDVLSGGDSLSEAKELQSQLIGILNTAGMQLHKWCGNHADLTPISEQNYTFDSTIETKTLGVSWKPVEDNFVFRVTVTNSKCHTKRDVLSTIARLFDPLGLLGPTIAKAKIFLQKLWCLNIDWNDQLPAAEQKEWQEFLSTLSFIDNLKIPRCIVAQQTTTIEIHGFCDASENCYGAAVYCKSIDTTGEIFVTLIASKSRVAPLKSLTIPRLELCAAVLLSKLVKKLIIALKFPDASIYLWSDSMIVLCWLEKEPSALKTFVSHRVATVQSLTETDQWRHVASEKNPADLISRGRGPDKLLESTLWFHGPDFLQENEYPSRVIYAPIEQSDFDNELKCPKDSKSNCLNVTVNAFFLDLINHSNVYNKILYVLAYILRFIGNCKSKVKVSGPLLPSEKDGAEVLLLKSFQKVEFASEIKSLKQTGKVGPQSQVKNLFPFLDENGVMRVGGRIAKSSLCYNQKFPILLPKNHRLTYLIIEMYHKKYLHIGPQSLLFLIRQKFWPMNGRNMCRKVFHQCVTCFKAKPITCEQIMSQLPSERVNRDFPFNITGVDFCGHFWVKYPNQRKGRLNKIYICVFVCMVTKACHLELVNDLSSEAFIASLKRFFSRRGKSAHIFSDNAKNFIGANLELKRLCDIVSNPDQKLSKFLCCEGVDWSYIPPRSPHHGGLWEACVKSVKFHLKRIMGSLKFTYEEFLTTINQIEGILNSRPLYPMSEEVEDFDCLTPGHFLVGRPITAVPEPKLVAVPDNRLKSWQKMTKIVQNFWKNWSNNYLSSLQQRNKWYFEKNNLKIGDMVILKEDNLPVCSWPLGRIIDIHKGKDNKVRVVSIKTTKGIYKRSINSVCILPIIDNC